MKLAVIGTTIAAAVLAATAQAHSVYGYQAVFSVDQIGLGPNGYVTLRNFTDVRESMKGIVLCQESNCQAMPKVTVRPGLSVRIAVGSGSGVKNVVLSHAHLGTLKQSDGEIAMYASGDASHPKNIVAYMQWGKTPHARTAEAVKAGLWLKTAYAPTAKNATLLFKQKSGLWLFDT